MKSLTLVLVVASLLFSTVSPVVAASPTINNGRLIRGSTNTIYWQTPTGLRYAFPDANTYYTWFADFRGVKRVSDTELNKLPLMGNVTYRPGAKLVKVAGHDQIFAVARYGELRLIPNETLAQQLYGKGWKSYIRVLPASLMRDYSFGHTIEHAWEYHVASQYHGVRVPSESLYFSYQPPQTRRLALWPRYQSVRPGDTVHFYAQLTGPAFIGPHGIVIYDEQQNIIQYCNDYQCEGSIRLSPTETAKEKRYFAYVNTGKKDIPIASTVVQINR